MIQYPLHFKVKSDAKAGVSTPFTGEGENLPPVTLAIPKEFHGPGGGYSPEELFALAVIGCITATFKVFAERVKLTFSDLSSEATLTIDRAENGVPELQSIDVTIRISGASDQGKAKQIMAEAEKYCLVSNAIKTKKTFTVNFL